MTPIDEIISELVKQRGPMKLCFDKEDGWFVQFEWCHYKDGWVTLTRDIERHATPTVAICDAKEAHNDAVNFQEKQGLFPIHQIIP